MKKRMDCAKFNIGTYCLQPYARTETHIRELSECGIDFVIGLEYDKATLDLFRKYGIGAVLSGTVPGWWGGDGQNSGKLAEYNPLTRYDEAADRFCDHPAIWAIDIGDEPSALDFPHYSKIFNKVNTRFPNQFPYINLYPNYGSVSQNSEEQIVTQLGTSTYEEYIAKYCEFVPSNYICCDFYPYSINVYRYYDNLRVVANASKNSGRQFWIVLQVNSNKPEEWISEDQLRFQAYSAMAFGVENIIWACYTAGWWHNQVLNESGEKTEQYDKLKKINSELHTISEEYMRYSCVETHFVGFDRDFENKVPNCKTLNCLNTSVFLDVSAAQDSPLIIGELVPKQKDGSSALMICTANSSCGDASDTVIIRFHVERNKTVTAYSGNKMLSLRAHEDGYYYLNTKSNRGILIIAK